MTSRNPYAPPKATVADLHPSESRAPRYAIAALVAVQLLASWYYSGVYFELVRTGGAHPLALLLGIAGSLCLYVAAILIVTTRSRGEAVFLAAAVALASSVPMWRWPYPWSLVAAYGAALGVAGWWIVRRLGKATASGDENDG